jgi:hypothetical protein
MEMENVLVSLPSKISPEAVNAGAPESLKTGSINYGKDLFESFVEQESKESTQIMCIKRMADAGLTFAEFREAVKKAQETADTIDKATGFTAKPDAKGMDKYGPKRKLINSRMSEAKMLFGTFKFSPDILKEKGYWAALQAAREYLNSKGIKWDGERKLSDSERTVKKVNKEVEAAEQAAKDANPIQPGESYKEWKDRIAPLVDEYYNTQKVQTIHDGILALTQDAELLGKAIFSVLQQMGTNRMHSMAQMLHEAAEQMVSDEDLAGK